MFKLFDFLPRRVRRAMLGDHVKITARVIIRNGDRVIVAENRLVSQGIKILLEFLASVNPGSIFTGGSNIFHSSATIARIRLGTDTATPTTEGITTLSAEISTDRNSASVVISKIAAGQYRVAWTATWNAGTVSGTIGELGLSLSGITPIADGSLPSTNPTPAVSTSPLLFSRLSSASADFSAFAINTAVPLTVEWQLNVTF